MLPMYYGIAVINYRMCCLCIMELPSLIIECCLCVMELPSLIIECCLCIMGLPSLELELELNCKNGVDPCSVTDQ